MNFSAERNEKNSLEESENLEKSAGIARDLRTEEIRRGIRAVREKIAISCGKAGRDPGEVRLLAVSKKKPLQDILAACEEGQRLFGENYVQELMEKYELLNGTGVQQGAETKQDAEISINPESPDTSLPIDGIIPLNDGIEWHMIGHLQRNKVKYIIGKTALIHSVDSLALAEQISKESVKRKISTDILLEINIAGEESKFGFAPGDASIAAGTISRLPGLRLLGLMCSAPYTEDAETNRPYFRKMRELLEELRSASLLSEKEPILSMGMTGDYQVAVEEGATIVRVGTAIFGER